LPAFLAGALLGPFPDVLAAGFLVCLVGLLDFEALVAMSVTLCVPPSNKRS
jgi:hypothetical protein